MLIPKKISWLFLAVFIIFDNIFSYFAIVYHGMREWGLISGFFVSITPLYYFVSIPLTLAFLYFAVKFVGWIEEKTDKSKKFARELNEQILLACLMIAWGIGATLFNLITFLKGFSPVGIKYEIFLFTGISIAIIYGILAEFKFYKKK